MRKLSERIAVVKLDFFSRTSVAFPRAHLRLKSLDLPGKSKDFDRKARQKPTPEFAGKFELRARQNENSPVGLETGRDGVAQVQ